MISGSSLSLVRKGYPYSAVKSTYTRERKQTKQWQIRTTILGWFWRHKIRVQRQWRKNRDKHLRLVRLRIECGSSSSHRRTSNINFKIKLLQKLRRKSDFYFTVKYQKGYQYIIYFIHYTICNIFFYFDIKFVD